MPHDLTISHIDKLTNRIRCNWMEGLITLIFETSRINSAYFEFQGLITLNE